MQDKEAPTVTRKQFIDLLNEDLSREYHAITAYVHYSNIMKGAKNKAIADDLVRHAHTELEHARIVADQIGYLGGMKQVKPAVVRPWDKPEEMLRFRLENETVTIANYRDRVKQAEALGEYALAENLRRILAQEQEQEHDLMAALNPGAENG